MTSEPVTSNITDLTIPEQDLDSFGSRNFVSQNDSFSGDFINNSDDHIFSGTHESWHGVKVAPVLSSIYSLYEKTTHQILVSHGSTEDSGSNDNILNRASTEDSENINILNISMNESKDSWKDTYNVTVEQYLQKLNAEFANLLFPAVLVLAVLLVLGTIGNIFVLHVYTWRMRAGTITRFIQALAVFDLLSCSVAIPGEIIDMTNNYTFGRSPFCQLVRTVNLFCTLASGATLVVVAIDRYQRICCPLRQQISPRGAVIIICGCTAAAMVVALPTAVLFGNRTVSTYLPSVKGSDCSLNDRYIGTLFPLAYNGFQMLLFLVGALILIVLYSFIARRIFYHAYQRQQRRKSFIQNRQKFANGTASVCSSPSTTTDNHLRLPPPSTLPVHQTGHVALSNGYHSENPQTDQPSRSENEKVSIFLAGESLNLEMPNHALKNQQDYLHSSQMIACVNRESLPHVHLGQEDCLKVTSIPEKTNPYHCEGQNCSTRVETKDDFTGTEVADQPSPETFPNTASISDDQTPIPSCQKHLLSEPSALNDKERPLSLHENSKDVKDDFISTHQSFDCKSDTKHNNGNFAFQYRIPNRGSEPLLNLLNVKEPKNDQRASRSFLMKKDGRLNDKNDSRWKRHSITLGCVRPCSKTFQRRIFFTNLSFGYGDEKDSLKTREEKKTMAGPKERMPNLVKDVNESFICKRKRSSFFGMKDFKTLSLRSESAGTRRTTLMLFLITLVYIVSFLPHLVMMTIKALDPNSLSGSGGAWEVAHNLLIRSYFINSMANPIIYSFFSKNFFRECQNSIPCVTR